MSVWLSPMQQLQLCVGPTFTLGFRILLSQHLFPKAATKAKKTRVEHQQKSDLTNAAKNICMA